MTKASFATRGINRAQTRYDRQVELFIERRNAIRLAINAAAPAMPDAYSFHPKLLTAKRIWREGKPLFGSPAEVYLNTQGVLCYHGMVDRVRFHSSVLHETMQRRFPAIIAAVHNLEGIFVGLHKTYLASDCRGLAELVGGETRRMLGSCGGSFVQLCEPKGQRLVLAENIELALSAQQACPDLPVWSAMSPGNMKSPIPSSFKEIVFYVRGDMTGPDFSAKHLFDAVRDHSNRGLTIRVARDSFDNLSKDYNQ